MARDLNMIVIHCSASDYSKHDDIRVIRDWHKERGFDDVGYHYYIRKDGTVQQGRHVDEVGAHARGYNAHSIGICLGGLEEFTHEQMESCATLIMALRNKLGTLDVVPHRVLARYQKKCPNFDMNEIYRRLI